VWTLIGLADEDAAYKDLYREQVGRQGGLAKQAH
jgi:hypothetical protein